MELDEAICQGVLLITGGDLDKAEELISKTNAFERKQARAVGFGDLDFEHGSKGPSYGSDEVVWW